MGKQINEGGEGRILEIVNDSGLLLKQYNVPTSDKEQKIKVLSRLCNLPGITEVSVPLSPVYSKPGSDSSEFLGFIMPRIKNAEILFTYLDPHESHRRYPSITTKQRYILAHNLAAQVSKIHSWDHTVLGDINFSNILVSDQLKTYVIDFDSVQHTNGRVYTCPASMAEFEAPEGREKNNIITKAHDEFALAILIFQLLRMGEYPFNGKLKQPVDESQIGLYLKNKGIYPYAKNNVAVPPDGIMPYDWLEPQLRAQFRRTFHDGSKNPSKRTSASEWQQTIRKCFDKLQYCSKHPKYHYGWHLSKCPLCEYLKQ